MSGELSKIGKWWHSRSQKQIIHLLKECGLLSCLLLNMSFEYERVGVDVMDTPETQNHIEDEL